MSVELKKNKEEKKGGNSGNWEKGGEGSNSVNQ